MSVVMLASTMAETALPKPSSTAVRGARRASSSSRIRSKMSTFASTAIPIERIRPAIPGSVRVAFIAASPPSTRSR